MNTTAATEESAMTIDAMDLCNGCSLDAAIPSSPAGYCARCEREARTITAIAELALVPAPRLGETAREHAARVAEMVRRDALVAHLDGDHDERPMADECGECRQSFEDRSGRAWGAAR